MQKFRSRYLLLATTLAASLVATGCATVDSLNRSSEQLVKDTIRQSELNQCSVHAAPCLGPAEFAAVNVELNQIAVAGREFTKLRLRGTATVADASAFLATVAQETTTLLQEFPNGPIGSILTDLSQLQTTMTKLLNQLLGGH